MALASGDNFAGCRILQCCGRGAFGTVYLAENAIGKAVALKLFDSPEAGERELRGIRNYMRLPANAPALITIHHTGIEDGKFYYIMDAADNAAGAEGEYVPDTLALRLKKNGRLSLHEAAKLCLPLADGLETMHTAGLLHRDLKPSNILFINGMPVLGDPGVAGDYSHTLSVAGTLGYLPPELFNAAARPSPSNDIYALGKVLYCSVTGKAPGEYPSMPTDLDDDVLLHICRPLARLCNALPEKRCRDCNECRNLLRQMLRPQSAIAKFFQRFRFNPLWRRKFLTVLSLGAAALFILTLLFVILHTRRLRQLRQQEEMRRQQSLVIGRELQNLQDTAPQLEIQLHTMGIATDHEKALADAAGMFNDGKVDEAGAAIRSIRQNLTACAMENVPLPAPENASINERFLANARIFGYLDSPLGKWHLPAKDNAELAKQTGEEAVKIAEAGAFNLVVNGRDFNFQRSSKINMKFLPPGSFHSPVTGKTETIDYPFWMMTSELTYRQAIFISKAVKKRDGHLDMPVTLIAWNDLLTICYDMTSHLNYEIGLPPGYAIRPATEAEWEYAAMGGMTGKPPAPAPNQNKQAVSAEDDTPANKFGLRNLDRNLTETVIPYPGRVKYPGWTIARGADFRQQETNVDYRLDMRYDQTILDYIGHRLVLAPVDKNFYTDAWYQPVKVRTAEIHNRAYAGFDASFTSTTYKECREIVESLGGRLPEPESATQLLELYRALQLDVRFPAPLGIVWKDGAWRHLSDGRPSKLAAGHPAPPADSKRINLCMNPGPNKPVFITVTSEAALPTILIEYPDRETMEKRPRPQLTATFQVNGRKFGLLKTHMSCYIQPVFVEFAGYRLPDPIDGDTRDKLLQLLKTLNSPVSIGAFRNYRQFQWHNHTPLQLPHEPEFHDKDKLQSYPFSYEAIVADNGQLYISVSSDYILVEL